jgi:deoxyribodipyrimidine photo-lyase
VTTAVLWFRRDLRLADHPALVAAHASADEVIPVFVLDPALLDPSGPSRRAFLYGALKDLQDRIGLRVLSGRPEEVLPRLGADSVHISSDHGPYGRARDERVAHALGDTPLIATGSPYGVTPGVLRKADDTPYKVFTPFMKAWRARGIHSPAPSEEPRWTDGGLPTELLTAETVTEEQAHATWEAFREQRLNNYAQDRDRMGIEGTSRLSPYLKFGLLHPRTLHAELGPDDTTFGNELIWRDFYADVLHHHPASARNDLTDLRLEYDDPDGTFEAWKQGRTGYPIVDAGMRQLLEQGWMHNRVRMIVASFLTKDLHVWWPYGARHFMKHLVDGDLASNSHGWQWTAGTGTDASPYFRVFNPVIQGLKFDPEALYLRRWLPELRHLDSKAIHEPWTLERLPDGYPARIVDHAVERQEALDRYERARSVDRSRTGEDRA